MAEDILVRVGADVSYYVKNLKRAEDRTKEFSAKVVSASLGIAGAFTGIAVSSAAGIGIAIKYASDYEHAFNGVRKTTEATEAQFDKLSDGVRQMSKEMPASAIEIANVGEVAGQLGIKADDILDFTKVMINMGVATTMTSSEAATSMARFANITGMSMDKIENLGSTIVHLGNNLATTEGEIMQMGLRLAGAGSQIGLTEDQILSFSGALSSVGVRAEAGGTAFSRVFMDMNTAVMDGGAELEKWAKVAGVSASSFQASFEDDAAGAIMQFIKGLDEVEKSGGNVSTTLDELGLRGVRVQDSLMRAAGASDLFTEALDVGSSAWDKNSALSDEAAIRYAEFGNQLKIAKNIILDFLYVIGTPLMEALGGILTALMPILLALDSLSRKFHESSDKTKQVTATIILLIPVVALLAAGIAFIIAGLGTLALAMGTTIAVAALLVAKIAAISVVVALAIVAVGAFALALVTHWDTIINKSIEMADSVVSAITSIPSKIAGVAAQVGEKLRNILPPSVVAFIDKATAKVVQIFNKLVQDILDVLDGDMEKLGQALAFIVPTMIGMLVGGLPGVLIAASAYLPAIADTFLDDIDVIIDSMHTMIEKMTTAISDHLPRVLAAGVEIVESLLQGVVESIPVIIEAADTIVSGLLAALTVAIPEILEAGALILSTILEGISEAIPLILGIVIVIIDTLVESLAETIPVILEAGNDILMTLLDGILEALPLVIDMVIVLLQTILETIIDLLPIVLEAGMSILLALVDGVLEALPAMIEAIGGLLEAVIQTIAEALPELIILGLEIVLKLIIGLLMAIPSILFAADTIIWALIDAIISLIGTFIVSGVKLIVALAKGIVQAVGQLLVAGADVLGKLLVTIAEFFPKALDAGIEFVVSLATGIMDTIDAVIDAAVNLGKSLFDSLQDFESMLFDLGKDLIMGLIGGIAGMKDAAIAKAKEIGGAIKDTLVSFFSIKSPSRVMKNEVGKMIGAGLIVGMNAEISAITKMAKLVSEAATPEQPKLAGFTFGDMKGVSGTVTAKLRAETGGSYESQVSSMLDKLIGEDEPDDDLSDRPIVLVSPNGRVLAEFVAEDIEKINDKRTIHKRRSKGIN